MLVSFDVRREPHFSTFVQAQPFRLNSAPDPEELGCWVIEKGRELRSFDRGQTFTATLPLDFLNKGSFEYKYVRADAIPEWERGENREWVKPEKPLRCGFPSLTRHDGFFSSGQPMGEEHANKIGYLASNAAAKDWTQSHLASIRADLHESETRVQRKVQMESERLQLLFNRTQRETHGREERFAWFPFFSSSFNYVVLSRCFSLNSSLLHPDSRGVSRPFFT